jgi:voltage-gated potassium channel
MIKAVRNRRHLALLIVLLTVAILEPLAARINERVLLVGVSVAVVINVGVLMVIFERRWERLLGLFLIALIFGADILHELSSYAAATIFYHCSAALFLAFAVAVILIRIFQRQTIRTDDVIGALCGYLLAAAAWGNLYAIAYFFWPASFRIADPIASQFGNWQLQRFFFDYFSVMTLTTMGFSDIAPAAMPVYSLTWVESVFGQFYIAVVVAQLVGLRLAQAIKPGGSAL